MERLKQVHMTSLTSYCRQIVTVTFKKAKITKNILDKKAFVIDILATTFVVEYLFYKQISKNSISV